MVTADGMRSGATEQLAAFTRLLGIQLIVAHTPAAIARAVTFRQDGAPVIIDGPGTNPFDPAQRDAVASLAAAAGAHAAFVLAAGACPGEAGELGSSYAEAGAAYLIPTRLDLARRLGAVLSAADAGKLALSESGVGPGVADGLSPLTPEDLAERLARTASTFARLRRAAA